VIVSLLPGLLIPLPSPTELDQFEDPSARSEQVDNRLQLQNDVRATIFQGLSAIFFLVSALLTIRQLQHSQRQFQLSEEQIRLDRDITRMDQEATTEAQLTERYMRAIDLISSDRNATRLGGIASLEQVAKQSKSHFSAVIDVLESHIRDNSTWPPPEHLYGRSYSNDSNVPTLRIRSSDVQAAITVISHLQPDPNDIIGFELSQVDLRKADLIGSNLRGANLSHSNLQGADLREADLREANLSFVNLQGADLSRAKLQRVLLFDADLGGAMIRDADLTEARFNHATRWPQDFNPVTVGAIHVD
jgi:uncharacterized protein YjbI with pentapeptide repeats